MSAATMTSWPAMVFETPVLRGLDESGRNRVMAAGKLHRLSANTAIYREQHRGDSFFVVISGAIQLRATPRGYDAATVLRTARRGETFGDEASLPGALRRATAITTEASEVVEIPFAIFRRVAGRSGEDGLATQEYRILRRQATQDLLNTMAFSHGLSQTDMDLVLDAVRHESFVRGQRIYGVGDLAERFFMIASGIVQLQTEQDERVHVRAYLSTGDFFGDEELLQGCPRVVSAVAMGACQLLSISGEILRTIAYRNPQLLGNIRRIASDRHFEQQNVVQQASAHTTQHVFKDLYRMQMASSLLTIDQDLCVRCGHCAWTCSQLYGVARLVRRGDKVLTQLTTINNAQPKNLLIPNSCQHCKNPVCMIDCPTGAIGRDPEGEVFIREELCTGCGNCAKACPWENIRMAPRPKGAPIAPSLQLSYQKNQPAKESAKAKSLAEMFPEVATKCDLCRSYTAPGCVQACPTEAIVRLEPTQDFAEVAQILGNESKQSKRWNHIRVAPFLLGLSVAMSIALAIIGTVLQEKAIWHPLQGVGYIAGWTSAGLMVLLIAYVLPKRAIRLWMHKRPKQTIYRAAAQKHGSSPAKIRSRVRPFFILHLMIGILVMGTVLVHAGARLPGNVAGALQICFWLTACFGIIGASNYRWIPARLSRLERKGALPEDLKREKEALIDRLYKAISGKSDELKRLADQFLIPYALAKFGSFQLLMSGRNLRQEQERLQHHINTKILRGHPSQHLEGLHEVLRIVIELRALPARRWLSFLLRAWMPLHILFTGVLLVLLIAHVLSVMNF